MSFSLEDQEEALALLSEYEDVAQWPLTFNFDDGAFGDAETGGVGEDSFEAMLDIKYGLAFAPTASIDDGQNTQEQMASAVAAAGTGMLISTDGNSAIKKKKKKPVGYNSNKARNERREELIILRKTVQSLESQLNQLKDGSSTSRDAPASSPSRLLPVLAAEEITPRSRSELVESAVRHRKLQLWAHNQQNFSCLWEEIAARQFRERQRAELENIRLKLVMDAQIKMAKSLERLLHRQTSLKNLEAVQGHKIHGFLQRIDSVDDDETIFNELRADLENSLSDVDEVFGMNGAAGLDKSYRNAHVRQDKVTGAAFMIIVANKAVPFDLESTGNAVWRHFAQSMDRVPTRYYYEKKAKEIDTKGDTITESFGLQIDGGRSKGHFRVKQIMKKFVQDDRIVIAWRAHGEAVEISAVPTNGIILRERDYSVVIRTPDHTLIQTCYIIQPEVYGEIQDRERKLTAVTEFLLKSIAGTINTSHQMIENDLMDEVLRNVKLEATKMQGEEGGTQVTR